MGLEDVYQRNLSHRTHRAGWLRAAVLGANDGLVSTASLMIGVAAARAGEQSFLITAGAAGIAAGAMSMAVGEYVSVRSQNDIEESDRLLEIEHLAMDPAGELEELVQIYMQRGLSRDLALQVAEAMHQKDPLAAHLRDRHLALLQVVSFHLLGHLLQHPEKPRGVSSPSPSSALPSLGF